MRSDSQFMRLIAALGILVIIMTQVTCKEVSEPPVATANLTPTVDVPAGILEARESVLDFLRDGANECVPPEQASWTAEPVANPLTGYDVYRFHSGGCVMTITVAAEPTEEMIYHVALGDGVTGFCWQAVVGVNGQILLTGNAAQSDPALGNPAQKYCEQQGYTFEVVTQESGQLCGMCIFEEGLSCNAWAFFHGACTPENALTSMP
jgi:putative hemolysin